MTVTRYGAEASRPEVAVVRLEERPDVAAATLEHPLPLVDPEGRLPGLVQEERSRGDEERRRREPSMPGGEAHGARQ
jgi:hypothetical protein